MVEPATPMELGKATNNAAVAADGNGAPKKRWNRQPINKKVKRIRRNRRLRKMLIPKNALMSLNELMGSTISEYDIVPEERGFVARVYVNNVQYEGRGNYHWTSSSFDEIDANQFNEFVVFLQVNRKLPPRIMHRRRLCVI